MTEPLLSSVSPTSYTANNTGQTMELLGSNFVSGDTLTFVDPQSRVYANEATTFVSSSELEASFNNGDDPGTWKVEVNSSSGSSSYVFFTVAAVAAAPTLSSVSPTSYPASNSNQAMELVGSDFASGDTLTFTDPQGDIYPSAAAKLTVVSSSEIEYQIDDGSDPGTWSVRVNSSDGNSNSVSFSIAPEPTPSLSSVSPTSYPASNSSQAMELVGSNFESGDTLTFTDPQGDIYPSAAAKLTVVSSSEIEYQIDDGSDPGTWSVQVNCPDGAHSGSDTFTVAIAASVTGKNFSIGGSQSIGISPYVSLSNPNNDSIGRFAFLDEGGGNGYFTINGTAEPDGQWAYSNTLSNVDYVAGSSSGSQTLGVAVYDATTATWSLTSFFTAETGLTHNL